MNHKQIVYKLTIRGAKEAIEREVKRLVRSYSTNYFLPLLLQRWHKALTQSSEDSLLCAGQTAIALATTLHKYGITEQALTNQAVSAVDALNEAVVLSDSFYHKADKIKAFLTTEPITPKRKPGFENAITFYREGDIIAISLENKYYVAYIHDIYGFNEAPVLELYDAVFDNLPTVEEVVSLPAFGVTYNDGVSRVSRFITSFVTYIPDPAEQITLIGSAIYQKPQTDHLEEAIGYGQVTNIFDLQKTLCSIGDKQSQ